MLFRPGLIGRLPCPSEWYAPSGPPTLDYSFASSVPAGFTFTRGTGSSDSTWQDNPNQQTYNALAVNVPLINQWGLKMEPQSTNLFLNSDAPVTQNIALTVGTHVCWLVGTGSVVVAAAGGTFTGLGTVTNGVPLVFNCTVAGNASFTLAGTVYRVQVEKQIWPTSYIASTGTAGTRQETRLSANFFGGQLNRLNGTYWLECIRAASSSGGETLLTSGVGSFTQDNETDQLKGYGPSLVASYMVYSPATTLAANINTASTFTAYKIDRIAASYNPQRIAICSNYDVVQATSCAVRPATMLAITLGCGGASPPMNGYIRGFRYWNTTMSDQELHECTGPGYYGGKPVFDLDGTVANQWRMWTIARSGAASGIHTDGVMTDPPGTTVTQFGSGLIPPGTARFTSKGLLLDNTRNNYFPNSDALAASGTTGNLAATQTYMVSVRGSGSVTLTANTVVTPGLPVTVTQAGGPVYIGPITTVGTANFTRTGTIELAMMEQTGTPNIAIGQDQGPTTFIKTTTAAQNRQAEGISIDIGPWYSQTQAMYLIDLVMLARVTSTYIFGIDDGTGNNREQMFASFGTTGMLTWGLNSIYRGFNPGRIDPDLSQQPMPTNTPLRIVVAVSSDRKRQLAMNGVLGMTGALRQGGDDGGSPRPTGVTKMRIGMNQSGNISPPMFVKRWRYYDYAVFDEALRALSVVGSD